MVMYMVSLARLILERLVRIMVSLRGSIIRHHMRLSRLLRTNVREGQWTMLGRCHIVQGHLLNSVYLPTANLVPDSNIRQVRSLLAVAKSQISRYKLLGLNLLDKRALTVLLRLSRASATSQKGRATALLSLGRCPTLISQSRQQRH